MRLLSMKCHWMGAAGAMRGWGGGAAELGRDEAAPTAAACCGLPGQAHWPPKTPNLTCQIIILLALGATRTVARVEEAALSMVAMLPELRCLRKECAVRA